MDKIQLAQKALADPNAPEAVKVRAREVLAAAAVETTAPAPADNKPIIAGGKVYPSEATAQRMGETSAKALKTIVPPILAALNLPSKALGKIRGTEYLLQPETEAAQAAITGTGPLSSIARAGVGMAGQVASDPLTALGGLGLLSKLGKSGNLAKAVTTAAELPADVIGAGKGLFSRTAAGVTGVEREALEKAATKEGAAELAMASGKEAEIGRDLVNKIQHFEDFTPEREIVETAVKEMPAMDIRSVIRSLEQSKIKKPALTWERQANDKIQKEIDSFKQFAEENAWGDKKSAMISAADYYEKRKALDFSISWDAPEGERFAQAVNKAAMNARELMQNEILEGAKFIKKPEVEGAFASWSDKIKKLDKVKEILGLNEGTQSRRAESVIANLYGKNKTEQQEAFRLLGEIFDTDIIGQAKNAKLARSFGPEGTPGLFPNQGGTRGTIIPALAAMGGAMAGGPRGAALAIPAAMVASPLLATKTISGLNTAEDAARWLARLVAEGKTAPVTAAGDVLRSPVAALANPEEEKRRRELLALELRR